MEESLVVIRHEPFNAETPLPALGPTPTPLDQFYVRTNAPPPDLDPAPCGLEVGGAGATPLRLSLAELQELPGRTLSATLECAGNDRIGFQPLPSGEPWGGGAVSTGVWQGATLADVL